MEVGKGCPAVSNRDGGGGGGGSRAGPSVQDGGEVHAGLLRGHTPDCTTGGIRQAWRNLQGGWAAVGWQGGGRSPVPHSLSLFPSRRKEARSYLASWAPYSVLVVGYQESLTHGVRAHVPHPLAHGHTDAKREDEAGST